MDRKPFEPADGVTARWKKLHDLVLTKKVGEELTYREAMEVLKLDPADPRSLPVVQQAMRDAQAHLEKGGERTVGTVARFGWIVLDAQRELQQADRRMVKTRRAAGRVTRAVEALGNRREELSQFERERLDRLRHSATMVAHVTGRRKMDLDQLRKAIEGGAA